MDGFRGEMALTGARMWSVAASYMTFSLQRPGCALRAPMKSAGGRVPINGMRAITHRFEQGVATTVSAPSCNRATAPSPARRCGDKRVQHTRPGGNQIKRVCPQTVLAPGVQSYPTRNSS